MPSSLQRLGVLLPLVVAFTGAAGADDPIGRLDAALDVLRFGTPEARLEVAGEARVLFRELHGLDTDGPEASRIVSALLGILFEHERDEWNLFTLSRGLADVKTTALDPLFAELLDHPSANVRRSAAIHFSAHHPDEELARQLDRAWRREEHPRVRQALLEALTYNERTVHAEAMLELIWADDPAVAHTAIVELSDLKPAGALQALARRSRKGPMWLREEALSNVLEWKHSAEAVTIYAEHLSGQEPLLRNYAARQIRWLEHPDAADLMARLARDPATDLCVRRAVTASIDPTLPGAEEALLSVLAEATTPDNADVQRAAAVRLSRAGLTAFDPTEIPNEKRHHDCEWNAPVGGWHVAPPESWVGVRCWVEPGRSVSPNRDSRLARGREIFPREHFEADGRSWMLDPGGCWVEAEYVVITEGPSEEKTEKQTGRVELEATPEETEHPRIRQLYNLGLIDFVDRTDAAVAIAVDRGATDVDEIDALQTLRESLLGRPAR